MKILLVGFKLSIGNELYMNMLYKHLKENGIEVDVCGDSNYITKKDMGYKVANGGNSKQMIIDTINILNWYKIFKIYQNNYDKIFFISSHTLNNIAILLSKLFKNSETVSHIHDPIPHSGTNYGWIILLSQKIQAKITDKIIVYGKKLKEIIHSEYNISNNKIYAIRHGVYRKNRNTIEAPKNKKYISLLGRIDEYKGIDIFLNSIQQLDEKIDKNIKFVIGGKGDLKPYQKMIEKLKNRLVIKNYLIPDEEFDDILLNSYCLVLPYKDGTQTGNIQVAYYNACPVVVTDVGSIPELVENKKTGLVVNPNDANALTTAILEILNGNYIQMGKEGFKYYKNKLKWENIIQDLIKIMQKETYDNKKQSTT